MSIFDDLKDVIKKKLNDDIDTILKTDADKLPEKKEVVESVEGTIGQKAILSDPYFDGVGQSFIFRHKMSRISNKTLKDVSIRDWLVSSIIQTRVDTLMRFSRKQMHPKKLELGYKVVLKAHDEKLTEDDHKVIQELESFIYHCGRSEKTPPGDSMLFSEFLKLTTRDALTFGHVAVEKIFTRGGALHRFRPLPAESMYRINQNASHDIIVKELQNSQKLRMQNLGGNNPDVQKEFNFQDIDFYKYVQMSYDNHVLSAFGDKDMIFKVYNPQNFADSMGYCYSPLELAIINVTNHLNVENYNANFFTHGYAARGVLHLKGTVTQSQLTAFRRQFYSTISGTQNAWRTPIVSGLDEVKWVQMSGSAKEMEYLNYNNHLIRAICTQFQIDPVELGLDYLGSGSGKSPTQQANNEYKIEYSRERGLYPILMFYEDMINYDIFPALDPKLAERYKFIFTGYTDETPQSNIALAQAEMGVYSSMNDLLKDAHKMPLDHPAGDLPLNAAFWAMVEKNMTRGEIRETFFKDKGAATRKELAYLPGDPMFMGWQQLLMTAERAQKQDKMQEEQMKQQAEMQQGEHEREQEEHEINAREATSRHAHAAVGHESLKDSAKVFGAANEPINIGGQSIANPINTPLADNKG
jgi:hypothetical protein